MAHLLPMYLGKSVTYVPGLYRIVAPGASPGIRAGYGHVLLLHLKELIRPMSIGPDIMDSGTDSPALRPGIQRARRQGDSAIWCSRKG